MKSVLVFFICLLGFAANSQTVLKGKIIDQHSGNPVDYANIGVLEKSKGTVSNFDGSFELSLLLPEINFQDTLQISRIGYKTLKYTTKDFSKILQENTTIFIEPQTLELDGVVVKSSDSDKRRIGYSSHSTKLLGFWNDSLALGGEHASKIMLRGGPVKLEDLSFNVVANISDSLLVRVNVYELEKGLPGKNISRENILHTIKQRQGTITIDLAPYNIVVDNHFVVSLELLKIYGGRVGIGISAFNDGVRSYTRLVSQAKWKRMRKGFTIAFQLNTSPVDKNELVSYRKIQKRPKPKITAILWDTSSSMEKRALDDELKFLEAYFNELENTTVYYRPFGNRLSETKIFEVVEGQWSALRKELESCVYDGGGTQALWDEMMISDYTLLFTDGKNFPDDIGKDWSGVLFTVNGNRNANHKLLKEMAEDFGGNYLNLEKMNQIDTALGFIQFYQKDNLDYGTKLPMQNHFMVKGNVGDLQQPLSNVRVQVRNTDRKTTTDKNGEFSIKAFDGEVLDFSYPGRENASSIVHKGSQMLKIIMPVGLTILDEVVLEENQKLKEMHRPSKQNISTRWGKIDMERIGFGAKQLDGSEIGPASQTIMDAIEGKFSGVEVVRKYPEDFEMVALRDGKYTGFFASWDVDGLVYPPDRPPFHIDVNNVRDITIMPAAWAGARYGSMGRGGVIIIRTISATFDDSETTRMVKGPQNRYGNDAVELATGIHSKPLFVQRIAQTESIHGAYQQYIKERKTFGNLSSFYVETSKIFKDYWKNKTVSRQIISNLIELFPEDISALKILAYSYEEENMFEEAASIYEDIYELKQSLQAKRDLARVNVKLGNYKEAWKYYKGYISKRGNLTDKGLDRLVKKEMLVFIQNFGDEIGIDKSKFDGEKLSNLSLVVEWNDPNAQFELQFVSPKGLYFNWNNTTELSYDESVEGNLSEVFDIEELQQGNWLVNISYLGNQINLPAYLKFTLIDNNSGKETAKLITLRHKGVKYKVMNITNGGMEFY